LKFCLDSAKNLSFFFLFCIKWNIRNVLKKKLKSFSLNEIKNIYLNLWQFCFQFTETLFLTIIRFFYYPIVSEYSRLLRSNFYIYCLINSSCFRFFRKSSTRLSRNKLDSRICSKWRWILRHYSTPVPWFPFNSLLVST